MNIWRLVFREIKHRALNFLLAILLVMVASAGLLGSYVLLQAFDAKIERIVKANKQSVEQEAAKLEEEFRKITKRMGFNVMILPKGQDLSDFYEENYATETMPQQYAETLANSRDIVTIRHLLPMLQKKIEWMEQKRKILLIGVQGEMPWAHRDNTKPILKPVPPDTVAMGYELHQSLKLKVGDIITLNGRTFKVHALHPERGSIDDITIWIDLAQAQEMLDQQGRINMMMALECVCAWANVAKIRKEIQGILPETQVIEMAGMALARAESRWEAHRSAKASREKATAHHLEMRKQREEQLATIIPLVIGGCAVLIGVLAFSNVRDRRIEIGILRALGLRGLDILGIFLCKAIIVGFCGALLGMVLVLVSAPLIVPFPDGLTVSQALFRGFLTPIVLLVAPLITAASSWLPALTAARQNPAMILREE